jgi:chromate reductase
MAIQIVIGTNRTNSVSKKIGLIYQDLLTANGAASNIIDLAELPHDFLFSALYEKSGSNELFNPIREVMLTAQKYVFVVPEYNGSFPGVLKTFIDGLQFPHTFTGKKCALVGVSSGVQGGVIAMSHLTDIFNYCGMDVLALKPKLSHISKHLLDNKIVNELYMDLLQQQAAKLAAL